MGQNQPGGFQDDGVPPRRRRNSRRSRASACPGMGPRGLDEAEASPAQEAFDQARVQQLTPDSHDELVSNAADNDERRAARDGRAQYERRVRAQDEAPPPPSAAIRQAVDRAAQRRRAAASRPIVRATRRRRRKPHQNTCAQSLYR